MKILVVDDEMGVRSLFEQKFRKEIRDKVFTFNFAHSGEEAMKYLSEEGGTNLLILSDINMPGMKGLELLGKVRNIYPQAPPKVIMITAYGDSKNRQQSAVLGADDFLNKPIDFGHWKEKLSLELG